MAEALGVVASGIAIMQLVDVGRKFARELKTLSRQAGSPREVERCACQARLWWNSIAAASETFDDHCERYGDRSHLAGFIASNKILDDIEKETAFIEEDIRDAIGRLRKLKKGKFKPIVLIKWWYQKESILMPLPQIQLLQACLSVLMSSCQMESCRLREEQATSAQIRRLKQKNKSLRRTIKDEIRSIHELVAQVEQINRQRYDSGTYVPKSRMSTSIGLDALIELGESLAQTGHIPKTPRASPAPSDTSNNRYPSSNTTETTSTTGHRAASHSAKGAGQSLSRKEPRWIPPSNKLLRVDPDSATNATNLYKISEDGTRTALSAIVLKDLVGNIISITEAGRLGLKVVQQDEDEVVWIAFKNVEPKRTIGKVEMSWVGSETPVNSLKGLPIDCYVVEHCRPQLILGKPYWDIKQVHN